ncbi:proteasome subunit beta domain protein [Mycobacterium xenopi 3993]|nr:proteasome subunit beta domain protein [Mycobacterium xenopi 3993]
MAVEALYDAADDDSATGDRIWFAVSTRPQSPSAPKARSRCPSSALLS